MKTISKWNFPFGIYDGVTVYMPKGAEIIHVDVQRDAPAIWAVVDRDAEQVPMKFYLRVTGQPFTGEEGKHIGSFQMSGGALVVHLFAAKEA